MRRSKENTAYWATQFTKLFTKFPTAKTVEKRYKTLRYLLKTQYKLDISDETFEELIRDTLYLDRELRYRTEGEQVELKRNLEAEYLLEHDGRPLQQSIL